MEAFKHCEKNEDPEFVAYLQCLNVGFGLLLVTPLLLKKFTRLIGLERRRQMRAVKSPTRNRMDKEVLRPVNMEHVLRNVGRGQRIKEARVSTKAMRDAMWMAPGSVPLTMPPTVDWTNYEKTVPSDLRFKKLFPGHVAKQSYMKNSHGEIEALRNVLRLGEGDERG